MHMIGKWLQRNIHPGMGMLAGMFGLLSVIFGPTASGVLAAASDWPTYRFKAASDWPTYMFQNGHSGFNSSETIINPSTAPQLKLHWTHTARGAISSQPVVANNLVYWGSWEGYEHATDMNNVKVWATNLGTTTSVPGCSFSRAGVAGTATIATVLISKKATSVDFVGGGNASFYALNALNGSVIWHTSLGSSPSHFIWGSPAVYNGSVYVGMASYGDCPLVQGQLIQMNASTGSIQHVFNVVPRGCTGGSVWGAPTVDVANGTIFFATGNAGSCSSSEPLSVSIVQVRASNLSLVGYWHVPANEQLFDTDFGSTPTLFTATLKNIPTAMVGVPNKNGTYYAFNRGTLKTSGSNGPVWRARIAKGGACPECGDGSIAPGAWDGTSLYVAGGSTTIHGARCKGSLRKVNPATGAFIWEHCLLAGPVLGAVTVVRRVVVVEQGTFVIVVNASSGATLFRFHDTKAGSTFFGGASISNGVMYIGNADGQLYAFGK